MIYEGLWLDISPQLSYLWILRVIGAFALVVNSFGIYLILFHSMRALRTYKYFQFAIQLSSTLTDFWFSFAMEPVPLFPLIAGYCEGIASSVFELDGHIQMLIFCFFMVCQCAAIGSSFVYKHQTVAPSYAWYKVSKSTYTVFLCVAFFPGAVIVFLFSKSAIDAERIGEIIIRDYPHLITLLQIPHLKLYDARYNPFIIYFLYISMLALIMWSTVVVVVTAHIHSILDHQQQFMSTRTHAMQRATIRSLFLQATVPLVCYTIPVIFLLCVVLTGIMNVQGWCNLALVGFSLHASIASIIMMSSTISYRNGVKRTLKIIVWTLFRIGSGASSEPVISHTVNSRFMIRSV